MTRHASEVDIFYRGDDSSVVVWTTYCDAAMWREQFLGNAASVHGRRENDDAPTARNGHRERRLPHSAGNRSGDRAAGDEARVL